MGYRKRRGVVLFGVGCVVLISSLLIGGATIADAIGPPTTTTTTTTPPTTTARSAGVTTVLADETLTFPACPTTSIFAYACYGTVTKAVDISGQKELLLYFAETARGCTTNCWLGNHYEIDIKVVAPSGRTWNLDFIGLQDLSEQTRKWSQPGTQLRITFTRQLGSCVLSNVSVFGADVECPDAGSIAYTLVGRDN